MRARRPADTRERCRQATVRRVVVIAYLINAVLEAVYLIRRRGILAVAMRRPVVARTTTAIAPEHVLEPHAGVPVTDLLITCLAVATLRAKALLAVCAIASESLQTWAQVVFWPCSMLTTFLETSCGGNCQSPLVHTSNTDNGV